MKLILKERIFTWFDSFDVYDEYGNVVFIVEGEFSFGHMLNIYDANHVYLGCVKQKVLTFLPKFEFYDSYGYLGQLQKELTLFYPKYYMDFNHWMINGDIFEWDYSILNEVNQEIASVTKQLFHIKDTYIIDVHDSNNAFLALMFVLAVDAEKCSRRK